MTDEPPIKTGKPVARMTTKPAQEKQEEKPVKTDIVIPEQKTDGRQNKAEIQQFMQNQAKVNPYWAEAARTMAAKWNNPPEEKPENGWYTLADAYQEREPVQYIAAGLFELPSLNIVFGAPGSLKSFILADLAVCVAGGQSWLPGLNNNLPGRQTIQNPVIWLDYDNGKRKTHDRFEALARARKLPENTPLFYRSITPGLDASKRELIGDLSRDIQNHGVKLVVIDNLGTISGGVDENSGQMIPIMQNLRALAEETGAAVVVVHHQRKSNGNNARAGETLRGHSSIEAAIDLALLVERTENSEIITLKSTKTRGCDVHPFSAMFTYLHKNASEQDLKAAKFYGMETEESNHEIKQMVLETLKSGEKKQSELLNIITGNLRISINKVLPVLSRMVTDQTIKVKDGAKNARVYYL